MAGAGTGSRCGFDTGLEGIEMKGVYEVEVALS